MSVDPTLWSSEAWAAADDSDLLAAARSGSAEAYGELWRRHLSAAYAVASRYRGRMSPEDIVAEASARVLGLLRDGKGPQDNFRSYFLSTVRTVAVDHARRDLRVVPAPGDDLEALSEPVIEDFPGDGIDADLVREAFAGLSERDQRVLWHTTVEGEAPRTLAPVLGMTANAVSASAMRAREALRAQYLDVHAGRRAKAADSDECRWTFDHLGAYARGRLPKRQTERVRQHVAQCPHAAAVAAELTEINSGFPALLVPLVLLAGVSTPGFISAGALAGLGVSGLTGGASAGVPAPSAPSPAGAGQQVASVAASAAAIAVIAAGLLGAAVPAAPVAAPVNTPPVSSTTPAPEPAPAPAAVAPAPAPAAGVPPVPAPGPVRAVAPSATGPLAVSPVATPRRSPVLLPTTPSAPVVVPPITVPPATVPPITVPPTTVPPTTAPPPVSAPATVLGQVHPDGTGWARITDATGSLVVTLENQSRGGTLTADNKAWSCAPDAGAMLTCTVTASGRFQFTQAGVAGVEPVVVRFPDTPGASVTIPLG